MRALLDHGANVNTENNRGETSLRRLSEGMKSVSSKHLRVARLLLKRGADVNARNKNHGILLHPAPDDGSSDIAQGLVDYGVDANAMKGEGWTPLFRLIEASRSSGSGYSYLGLIELLVEHGADANARGEDNTTALQLASEFGRLGVARVLLNHGADVNAKNKRGRTPFHQLASADNWVGSNSVVVAQLLLENNVDVNARDEEMEPHYIWHPNMGDSTSRWCSWTTVQLLT